MEKRLFLTVALSLLVLLSWSAFVSKQYPVGNKGVTEQITPMANNAPLQATPQLPQATPQLEEECPPSALFTFFNDRLDILFIEPKAAIKETIFKGYHNYKMPLKYGLLLKNQAGAFKKESSSKDTVAFVYQDQGKKITKRVHFLNHSYSIELDIIIQNISSSPLVLNLPLTLGVLDFSSKNIHASYQDIFIGQKDKTFHTNPRKNQTFDSLKFIALRDRYFCAIIEPVSNNYSGFTRKLNNEECEIGLTSENLSLAAGQQIEHKFRIYLGPQQLQIINNINPSWAAIINYGTFDFISQVLLQLLHFLYSLVHNWGWAIVLFSLAIYLILYPLSLKQMRSMKEMQVLQPRIEQLRKAYKDNPQRLNKEIMELYKEHKVNPFGGCLPLLLQMPIFFALYQALMRSVELRGANFLWIKDLSEPDRLFILPNSLPLLGNEINILPIIMAIGMFFQQKISMSANTGSSAEQQKMMLILFPVMFGFIFYHMPSGLVLYWLINSTLMLIYQLRIYKAK